MKTLAENELVESGHDWLGTVPRRWGIKPFWALYRRVKRAGFETEELLSVYRDHGVIPKSSREDNFNRASDDLAAYQLVEPGDLAINKMKAWQGSVAVSEHRGIVSPAYFVYAPIHDQHHRYLHYLMRSPRYIAGYRALSKGIRPSQWDLDPQYHSRMPVLLPPLDEQRAIADFLDRETAKIDTLIKKQERLIELLEEKRQAVITRAVTKGLNPDVQMKDSGVEWLGEVPTHWGVTSLAHIVRAIGDVDHYMPPSVDEGFPYMMTGDLRALASEVEFSRCKQVSREDYRRLSQKILPSRGDVIMARYATIGTVSYVDVDAPFVVSYSCVTIKPQTTRTSGLFLFNYFKSYSFLQGIQRQVNTNTQGNVGIGDLRRVKVPLPPLGEQASITDYIQSKIDELDRVSRSSRQAIQLLKERRTALISAAVTGKIDVRQAV